MPRLDALKEALFAVVRAALPRVDYHALYPAKVVKYGGGLVDAAPDDPKMPPMAGVPLRMGVPGLSIASLAPGTSILVGWGEGDPARPYAALWSGGEGAVVATWSAAMLNLGGDAGEPPPRGTTYRAAEDAYLAAIVTAVNAALSALGLSAAAGALSTATGVWTAAAPAFLAKNVKVQ